MPTYPPRQIAAYGTVFFFLIFVFFYGLADTLSPLSSAGRMSKGMFKPPQESTLFPDFSHYEPLNTLKSEEFPLDDPKRRVIIVGDIHGMMKPLRKLLDNLNYNPSDDVLIHAGDIVTKGTHKGSMAILDFMTANNVTGVRGNHDQKVIEWYSWLQWIREKPGGRQWLENLEKRWEKACADDKGVEVDSWLQTNSASTEDKKWFRQIPKGWILFSDHYNVARELTADHLKYLSHLPLRIYVPSAHTFIVHAGLLPSNPAYPMDNTENQPLARVPAFPKRPANGPVQKSDAETSGNKETIDGLRYLQEISLLTEIPQNADPWVLLNMRNVVGDTVSRDTDEGRPWSKIWKQNMLSCVGYQKTRDVNDTADNNHVSTSKKKIELPCYPSTTIYGHAASRGLDVKRWSIGLDSGCVKGERLTALVLGGPANKHKRRLKHGGDEDDISAESSKEGDGWIPYSDNRKGRIVSVSCK
ncbi:Metallo-dependent phosphatase [Pholiota conissans]|uniref:Metallo-dependent phosphatase n=1 Tax=Pholiota conissans TaxID=109636 RepID=A0A9P5ZBK7_9AGAR|nr:Metallo-dependent phosphatase [Pholiota conissans]